MNRVVSLSVTLAIAVSASVGFATGYSFHLRFGQEVPAARQALVERDASQRVLDAYSEVIRAEATHRTFAAVKSMTEVKELQGRSKQALLATIERFSRIASEADDPSERRLAQAFLPQAKKIQESVNAEP